MSPQFRALRPDEQAECLDLWARVFSPSHDYFERYFRDPHWQPDYTRVCVVDGRLVAAVQVVRRPVRLIPIAWSEFTNRVYSCLPYTQEDYLCADENS